ncbi:MAG: site-specific DNA-methyltransferase [Saccharofermentanales bacterium]
MHTKIELENLNNLDILDREDLVKIITRMATGGVAVMFSGKRTAMEIQKKVRPRAMRKRMDLSFGKDEAQAQNIILEGENLQGMVTLYKYRNQIDLVVTDPPYNTGRSFRYTDKWDEDPNDPDLGNVVQLEDGSRHTKWMKAMLPRLQMMRAMLKSSGVLAICIDDSELFHLGMMLDEVFGEENRLAIINWQKTYSPKNDTKHVSTATEYVLVYAKNKDASKTQLLPRDADMNKRFNNPDNDPEGEWAGKDPTAKETRANTIYAIQSPFTGNLQYPEEEFDFSREVPSPRKHWTGVKKAEMKSLLSAWGTPYVERDIGDGRGKALVIKDAFVNLTKYDPSIDPAVVAAIKKANELRQTQVWPKLIFLGANGEGRPRIKNYLNQVKQGKVPLTFWANEDFDITEPIELGSQSWEHTESGHSQTGITELNALMGPNHGFDTVKPLKLIEKIIQLWCPPNGYILDPYAGSGTVAHAVLELNYFNEATRKFILIEQGSPERGDKYAKTLTCTRVKRAITGERIGKDGQLAVLSEPLGGGFTFQTLTKTVDSKTILSMQRDEMIDLIIATHWDSGKKNNINLIRIEDANLLFCVGKNNNDEGYFIVWDPANSFGALDYKTYNKIVQEAKKANLNTPYHVYARYEVYQDEKNVNFYKIPDKVLAHLGLNENSDRFNNEDDRGDM